MRLQEIAAVVAGAQEVEVLIKTGEIGVYNKQFTGDIYKTTALDEFLEGEPRLAEKTIISIWADDKGILHIVAE